MLLFRCISPDWLMQEQPKLKKVIEGQLTDQEITKLNNQGYNIYYLPNYPSIYEGGHVSGFHIDTFTSVFVDFDLKSNTYESKDAFIEALAAFALKPSKIVDSGGGIHAYWEVSDLDAKSYLRLCRRLIRHFKTDEAVGTIGQLMRYPNTYNTKIKDNFRLCEVLYDSGQKYTCEDLDKVLPIITKQDEDHCERHYANAYKLENPTKAIKDKIPLKFAKLLSENTEVNTIWQGGLDDRSAGDYRLGHIMFACGFTKEEAESVLVNSSKALSRAPVHRISYAQNIVEKIWNFEQTEDKTLLNLSNSVFDILQNRSTFDSGTKFPCHKYLDDTIHGFRLGQVIGLVAGVGVGKTAVALNMFLGFVQNNPNYHHFFVPLEQPAIEIAERWKTMCGENTSLYNKVQILSNYDADGTYRNLSLEMIENYIVKYQIQTGHKVGCVVIDHIGVLKKSSKEGRQSIEDICHKMKAFAAHTNTMLVMQSQAPREKAGIGDLELNKDAAYGTVFFESYLDFLITMWQPLKRVYKSGAPTVTAFKFCKIRHKKQGFDGIMEDVCYKLMFDPNTELLRPLTSDEEKSFDFFLKQATNKRKQDAKTDLVEYVSVR